MVSGELQTPKYGESLRRGVRAGTCSSALLSLGPPLPQLSPLALSLPFFLLPVSHFPPGPTLGLSRAGMELRREVVKG